MRREGMMQTAKLCGPITVTCACGANKTVSGLPYDEARRIMAEWLHQHEDCTDATPPAEESVTSQAGNMVWTPPGCSLMAPADESGTARGSV